MSGLRPLVNDEQPAIPRVLVDRRRSLDEDHTRMVSQLHQQLLDLIPGGAKKDLSPFRRRPCWRRSDLGTPPARSAGGWPRN